LDAVFDVLFVENYSTTLFYYREKTTLSFYCRRVIDKLFRHQCGILTEFVCGRVSIVIWLFVQVDDHLSTVDYSMQDYITGGKKLSGKDLMLSSATFNEFAVNVCLKRNFEPFDM